MTQEQFLKKYVPKDKREEAQEELHGIYMDGVDSGFQECIEYVKEEFEEMMYNL
jgi:hypothetical protein